ncbi:outer membrane protein OmpA [Mesorhizobium sp. 113-1-2]|uniref:outer membrane protein n=1 Tax=Mesorhizobium sp. 113-1-2 TaxID=2744515 RepID=UPI0008199F9E|nr:outer membrane beta-barrel protein [Mesorhizobium sp. 113-1-2]BAV46415.1 OmpA-like transmembrane domain-containing protein [Mesorhizobium loti]BCG72337.1 outer membrane protein OmpA [Mesorhizobium sp. 113-1-2]
MKSLLLASVFGFGLCAPALAADLAAPVVTPDWTWQGAYAGVFGAGTLDHYKITEPGFAGTSTHSVGSATIGGFTGYNFQSSNIVYGVEGELGYRFKKSTFHDVPGAGILDVSTGLFGSLKGRVGMDMGTYLPFVTAGVTAAQLKTFYPPFSAEADATLVGGIVGAGVDVALTHNVFLRGEYDFSFFGKKNLEYCGPGCQLDHTVQTHDFRVGVALKF